MQSQFDFEASTPIALPSPGAVMGCTASECEVAAIRARMTEEQISAERQQLTDRGMHRYDTGDRTGMGGPRGIKNVDLPFSYWIGLLTTSSRGSIIWD